MRLNAGDGDRCRFVRRLATSLDVHSRDSGCRCAQSAVRSRLVVHLRGPSQTSVTRRHLGSRKVATGTGAGAVQETLRSDCRPEQVHAAGKLEGEGQVTSVEVV
jgi:hypothetical protein